MQTNKGRLIPNIRPLSFLDDNNRSPYDGELMYDDKTNDIYYWAKDEHNVWVKHSRTAEIQEVLDSYGESGDNTFQNAEAFYDNGVIHRFFYSQVGQKVWLDRTIDISKYAYYAILSIGLDKGVHKYITGTEDSDGTDYLKALIPTTEKRGTLTKYVLPNTWYTVEFYNAKKVKLNSVNYLSYQTYDMPIDIKPEDGTLTNTPSNVKLTFSTMDKNGEGLLFTDQQISDLKPKLTVIMADGHTVEITDPEDMDLEGLDNIDLTKPGDYVLGAKYDVFENNKNEVTTISKTYKKVVTYIGSKEQTPNVEITLASNGEGWENRVIKTVEVLGIGNDDYVPAEYTSTKKENGDTLISISNKYFKIERNVVKITYTEDTKYKQIDVQSLKIQVYNTVHVVEHHALTYTKFYPVGYVEEENGVNVVKYKFFVLQDNNSIRNITDNVTITYPDNYTSNTANRLVASFFGYEVPFFSFFRDINQSGSVKRVLTSTNQSDLLNHPDEADKPVLVYSTTAGTLTVAKGSYDKTSTANIDYILGLISDKAEFIRVKSIRDTVEYLTDFEDSNTFSYLPGFSEYSRFNNSEPLSYVSIVNSTKNVANYSRSYELVKYKNITIENTLSTRTLKELLQDLPYPTDDFGTFIGYSVTNDGLLTEAQENTTIKLGDKIHIFAYFSKEFNEGDTVPKYFGGLLKVNYTLKKYSMRAGDPFLVEGYKKESSGKYTCLGAVVCHASSK